MCKKYVSGCRMHSPRPSPGAVPVTTSDLLLLQPTGVWHPQAKHHPDLIMCRKQPGIAIGRLCEKCDGKCVVCDSYVRPATLVRVCAECNYGSYAGRCVICGGIGISDAFYCKVGAACHALARCGRMHHQECRSRLHLCA